MSKLFPNTLSADGKYFLLDRDNLTQRIQIQLSQKQKNFSQLFSHFKKKMTLITDGFTKLRTPKNMVRSMPKKCRFGGSIEKQHGKCAQTLFKFEEMLLCHVYWSLGTQLSYKKSLLVIWKISRLFPNTLTAYGKYSVLGRDNLTPRIWRQWSQKQKTFCEFFSSFLKSSSNLEHLKKKDDTHSWSIYEFFIPKNMVISMPKKSHFRASVEKQHPKCAETLLKFEGQLVYHIYW